MPTDTNRGTRRDLVLVKGKAFERHFTSTAVSVDEAGNTVRTPLDLTQGTLRAKARRKLGDADAAITFTVEAVPANGPGAWRIAVDAQTMAASALVSGRDEDDPRALYERWDCEFAYDEFNVIELMWGELRVLNEATR
jgi:hypothetical protein